MRKAKQCEPVFSADDAEQLLHTRAGLSRPLKLGSLRRSRLPLVLTAVVSALVGAAAVWFLQPRPQPAVLKQPVSAEPIVVAPDKGAPPADSAVYMRIGHVFYRNFAFDSLFEARSRALAPPPGAAVTRGIAMLELSDEELARLGVLVEDSAVALHMVSPYEPRLAQRFLIGPTTIAFPPMQRIEEHDGITVPQFEPLLISDDRGMWRRIAVRREIMDPALVAELERTPLDDPRHGELMQELMLRSEESMRRIVRTLVPVHVRTGRVYTDADRRARKFRPDVVLWYEPTTAFLAHLPERLASRLRIELAAAELIASATATREQESVRRPDLRGGGNDDHVREERMPEVVATYVDRATGGDRYLDVWRASAGAVQGTYLYPNPLRDGRTVLHYRLAEPRTVGVALYDIWGRRLRELSVARYRESGSWEQELVPGDVPKGMYMVVLTTDRGEQAVQRLMVE